MNARYIAFPAGFNDWLEINANATETLAAALVNLNGSEILRNSVHAVDTFRATTSADGQVIVLWNTDYWDASGGCGWAFISADAEFGARRFPEIASDVITRAIKVASYRLSRSVLPTKYRLRTHDGNFKTCTAGSGDAYRHSLAFWDGEVRVHQSQRFAVLLVGPDDGPVRQKVTDSQERILQLCEKRHAELSGLVELADATVTKAALKSACDLQCMNAFETLVAPKSGDGGGIDIPADTLPPLSAISTEAFYKAISLTYDDWIAKGSPLTDEQRSILESNVIKRQPLRVNGPAGSGKTLLMQLLCIKQLRDASESGRTCRVLYVCHNAAMRDSLIDRFEQLGAGDHLVTEALKVETLAFFCSANLQLDASEIIDSDAAETKAYQADIVKASVLNRFDSSRTDIDAMPLLREFERNRSLMDILVELIVHEIGISIKGHNLMYDKRRYIDSEVPFSRLHGNITPDERRFVFEVFQDYYRQTTENSGLLDADDLAITLLSKLRTPLWTIRRKTDGVDFLFVDETQLFNENERRIFAYLPKHTPESTYLPVALALDEAQELKGAVSSGFGLLGIKQLANEQLQNVYRSTPSILKLAFFLIQHTTDLFGVDFPDFTQQARSLIPDDHPQAAKPCLRVGGQSGTLGNYIAKRAAAARGDNLRSVCIVVHAERYWSDALTAVEKVTGKEPYVLRRRGDVFGVSRPGIVMARPEQVGGQEFDAVICVGLEDGVVPPFVEQEGFAESLRQRALRELYLVFTRARFRLEVVVNVNASLTALLQPAIQNGLLRKA